jgi:hypothetical protein
MYCVAIGKKASVGLKDAIAARGLKEEEYDDGGEAVVWQHPLSDGATMRVLAWGFLEHIHFRLESTMGPERKQRETRLLVEGVESAHLSLSATHVPQEELDRIQANLDGMQADAASRTIILAASEVLFFSRVSIGERGGAGFFDAIDAHAAPMVDLLHKIWRDFAEHPGCPFCTDYLGRLFGQDPLVLGCASPACNGIALAEAQAEPVRAALAPDLDVLKEAARVVEGDTALCPFCQRVMSRVDDDNAQLLLCEGCGAVAAIPAALESTLGRPLNEILEVPWAPALGG